MQMVKPPGFQPGAERRCAFESRPVHQLPRSSVAERTPDKGEGSDRNRPGRPVMRVMGFLGVAQSGQSARSGTGRFAC